MKSFIFLAFIFFNFSLYGQNKQTEIYGFRHLTTIYKGDTVDILIKSKKGEEQKKKPLFLFCQGSLPIPLIIKYDDHGKPKIYNVFVFNTDSLSKDYHLAIINKPGIPFIADRKSLNKDMTYIDSTGDFPKKYTEQDLPDYYVNRNIAVIKFLRKQSWISKDKLVVAGHSEGSTIATKIAYNYPKVTELIYSSENPLGRIATIVEQVRENETDSSKKADNVFLYWGKIIDSQNNKNTMSANFKGTYQMSYPPPIFYLSKLKIPVLICYGSKDLRAVDGNDYLRIETIRLKKRNFTFKDYIGLEHNFFPLKPNGEINYDIFNWDKVAEDWRKWLMKQ